MLEPIVEVTKANVFLGTHRILHDVSLTITVGERVALMGANGSGKTTLIRTMCGLNRVRSGSVNLFGKPIDAITDWGRIGWVPQHPSPGLDLGTVEEIVTAGRVAYRRLGHWLTKTDRQAIALAMERTEITNLATRCFGRLSGGQRQRVLIARSLATNPSLLLLDEPLTGVDVNSQRAIATTLDRLADDGVTLCAVVHGHGPLTDMLHRAVVLEDGHVIYDRNDIPSHIADAGGHDHHHDHINGHHRD